MVDQVIKLERIEVNFSSYALARSSYHLFNMARAYEEDKGASIPRVFVLCVSLELGMKGAITSKDCSDATKRRLKNIGHNLVKLHKTFVKWWGSDPFDKNDAKVLATVSPLFSSKAMEYFTGPMLEAVACGHKGIPELEQLISSSQKLQTLLESNKYFIDV